MSGEMDHLRSGGEGMNVVSVRGGRCGVRQGIEGKGSVVGCVG